MARKTYRVLPHKNGGWQVKIQGSERAIKIHERKQDAMDHARSMAKANEPSMVFVHKNDGTVKETYKYGKEAAAEKKPAAKKPAAKKPAAKKSSSKKAASGRKK